jgi:hypothetical protein
MSVAPPPSLALSAPTILCRRAPHQQCAPLVMDPLTAPPAPLAARVPTALVAPLPPPPASLAGQTRSPPRMAPRACATRAMHSGRPGSAAHFALQAMEAQTAPPVVCQPTVLEGPLLPPPASLVGQTRPRLRTAAPACATRVCCYAWTAGVGCTFESTAGGEVARFCYTTDRSITVCPTREHGARERACVRTPLLGSRLPPYSGPCPLSWSIGPSSLQQAPRQPPPCSLIHRFQQTHIHPLRHQWPGRAHAGCMCYRLCVHAPGQRGHHLPTWRPQGRAAELDGALFWQLPHNSM